MKRGLKIKPGDPLIMRVVMDSLLRTGRYAEMENLARKALETDPQNPEFHFYLGSGLQLQGLEDEGYEEFQRALELDPSYALAYFKIGLIMAHRDRIDEAIAFYQKALSLNPDIPEALFNLGNLLFRQGEKRKGLELVKRSERLFAERGMRSGPRWPRGSL